MTATQTETCYEVVFGADEADRQAYIDHHDGSYISSSAHARATSAYVQLVTNGVACGFFVNGVLKNGIDPTAELVEPCEPAIEHKTRTTEGSVATTGGFKHYALDGREVETYGWIAQAFCTCGWSTVADDRTGARRAAKHHRAGFTTNNEKGKNVTKVGTRVFYTTDQDKTERSRIFKGNTIDHEFSTTAWRSALAGLVFGDFSAYYRIHDVRVEDILSANES